MSVGGLFLQSAFGKVYVSAPTHVAVNNFAVRMHETNKRVTSRLNEGLAPNGPNRERRKFIVRGFKIDDEIAAFRALVQNPDLGSDKACPSAFWRGNSKWKLPLSLAYWFLVVLGSPAVPKLHDDDAASLHVLHDQI